MQTNRGFTLIELMIVVAIIAILAAIALPAYQDYIARSQLTTGLYDITSGKSAFESYVIANNNVTFNVADIGLSSSTTRCEITMDPSPAGGFISCKVRGNPIVINKMISIVRSASGTWSCEVTGGVAAKFLPAGCAGL